MSSGGKGRSPMSTESDTEQEFQPPEWAVELRDSLVADPGVRAAARHRAGLPPTASNEDWRQFLNDIAAVLTVYDSVTAPENRGPWRDRLYEFLEHCNG